MPMGRRKNAPSNKHAQKADRILADIVLNRGHHPLTPIKVSDSEVEAKVEKEETDLKEFSPSGLASLVDFSFILTLVFGGCCSNVWAYEYLLKIDPRMGTALTFSQMAFITLTSLPSFTDVRWCTLPSRLLRLQIPMGISLKPRQVPLSQWAIQVLVMTTGSLLNNWAFAFHVPLTVQIVFRSGGLAISMVFGRLFLKKHYLFSQVASVLVVTLGVILATTSRPISVSEASNDMDHLTEYSIGVLMLTVSLFLTGILGLLQEKTYTIYGPCWREGVFYTHALALPIFSLFVPQIKNGFISLARSSTPLPLDQPVTLLTLINFSTPYLTLAANLITQLICVSGVNQLTSRVSSVSTNLVLTTRKAMSLLFSVWWFGNGWNVQLGWGAGLVFAGSVVYGIITSRTSAPPKPPPKAASDKARLKVTGRGGASGAVIDSWRRDVKKED